MKNTMEYRGYVGSVEFSEEDEIFYGNVLGIKALISYKGTDANCWQISIVQLTTIWNCAVQKELSRKLHIRAVLM